jgi:PAS domain S-box-containing protein
VVAVLFHSYSYQWFPGARRWRLAANAVAFGATAVALMIARIEVADGVFVDARNAPVALVALFEGPVAGGLAMLLPAAYRLWLGGAGMPAGLVALGLAAVLGSLAHAWAHRRGGVRPRHAFALGGAVFVATSFSFLLAGRHALDVYQRTWLPLLAFYVLGIGLAARLLQNVVEQARLRAAQQRFREILDEAPVAIRIVEPDTQRIVEVNRLEAELSGRAREDLVGRPVRDVWPEDPEKRRAWERFAEDGRAGATARAYGLAYRRRTGDDVAVDATRRVVEHGGQRYEIVVVREAAEREARERAEREAAELRAITLLAGAAAHEINNPLVVVLGALELVEQRGAAGDADARLLRAARDAGHRIRDIVARMVRITRVEATPAAGHLPPILDLQRSSEEIR